MDKKEFDLKYDSKGGMTFSILMTAYFIILVIGSAILLACKVQSVSAIYPAITSIFPLIALAIIVGIQAFKEKKNILPALGVKKFNPLFGVFAVVLAVGMFLGFGFLNNTFTELLKKIGIYPPQSAMSVNSAKKFIFYSFSIALFPAILEEVVFRGVILGDTKRSGLLFGIFSTAFVFAIYHASLQQLLYQFIYGVALCLLTVKSGSTIPAMIAHFINNFAILLFEFIKFKTLDLTNIWVILIGLVILAGFVVFMLLYKGGEKLDRTPTVENPKTSRGMFYLWGSLGILVCIIQILVVLF